MTSKLLKGEEKQLNLFKDKKEIENYFRDSELCAK